MGDDTTTPIPTDHQGDRSGGRGPRQGGQRDGGGFRIRLSDNEMQAARALQEAFGLRSTVAVLGFALRTLAQQLEQGQLEELVALHRAQGGGRGPAPRGGGGERRRDRFEDRGGAPANRGPRVDPFARPSKPAPAVVEEEAPVEEAPAAEASDEAAAEVVEAAAETSDSAAAEAAEA